MSKRQLNSNFRQRIKSVDPVNPDVSLVQDAAARIRDGGLVAFPTRGLYGIGADIYQPKAVSRVFQVKRRSPDKPISVLIQSKSRLTDLAAEVPPEATRLMDRFWPGRITIVFAAQASVPVAITGNTGKIGIRMPEHPVAVALLNELKNPITGTSANLSGQPGCAQIADVAVEIMTEMAMILDAGQLLGGAGSTVVDVTTSPPTVVREGLVSCADIEKCLE